MESQGVGRGQQRGRGRLLINICVCPSLLSLQWRSVWAESFMSVAGVSGQRSRLDASPSTGDAATPPLRALNTAWMESNTLWR